MLAPRGWNNRIVGYGEEAPDQLLANEKNPRIHPRAQQEALLGVLKKIGIVQNVIVNQRSGKMVDGHLRAMIGISENQPTIPVTYVDLSDEEEAAVLATLDPLSAMAGKDEEIFAELLTGMDEAYRSLVAGTLDKSVSSGLIDEDDAPEPPAVATSVSGDLWLLGEHRVLCGDSTSSEAVGRLCGPKKADLMVTDPPYGIKRDEGFGGFEGFRGLGKPIARRRYQGGWDDAIPPKECFDLLIGMTCAALVFGGNFFAHLLPQGKHWIVWDKNNTMPTFGDAELIWTNISRTSVKIKRFQYNGLLGKEKERFHPTQKPTTLIQDILNDYSSIGDSVLDPFLGSGSTLIACEKTGRICYGLEIAPEYVDVIVNRWQNFTGKQATLDGDGRTSDEIRTERIGVGSLGTAQGRATLDAVTA